MARILAVWRGTLIGAAVLLATAVVAGESAAADEADKKQQDAKSVVVRLKFEPGRLMRYNITLAGQTAWTPALPQGQWGQMATDFTFVLRTKTVRPDASCTFDLLGETLRCTGQSAKGRIDVAANRQRVKLGLHGRDSLGLAGDRSPLAKPMTVTLAPRGQWRFGTGLAPMAIFMLPNVDHRFWTQLTTAPKDPVTPGDDWQLELNLPVPGSKGLPLKVRCTSRVAGWEKADGRNLLAIESEAKLELKDTNLLLNNGDKIHVVAGNYHARGKALWDVEAGYLFSAEAHQQLAADADLPIQRQLRSENRCKLRLLHAQEGPVGQR